MLGINFIRDNPECVREGIIKKNADPKLIDKLLRRDEAWRIKTKALDDLKAEQNSLTKTLAENRTEETLSRAQLLKQQISKIIDEEAALRESRDKILTQIPNIPFDDVPVGDDESGNKEIKQVGKKPVFRFTPRDYLSVAEELGIIDVKKASQVAGTRFGYLLRDAALLEFALIQLALNTLISRGFIPIIPPVMLRTKLLAGMGRLAPGDERERYYFPEDDLYLAGSAEHTIGPFHMNETLDEKQLPLRYVGFSTCFRREAGSYGKDTKGILRVHQFDKVEMFSFTTPAQSEKELRLLLSIQEELMGKLELPYRVVEVCTGDMGWTDARQYDIEAWLPSEERYRETHSASNTTDFQARGIGAKYKPRNGEKPYYLHMLNATAFAIGRMVIAIIENYQTKQGSVRVPKALQKYMGKKEIV